MYTTPPGGQSMLLLYFFIKYFGYYTVYTYKYSCWSTRCLIIKCVTADNIVSLPISASLPHFSICLFLPTTHIYPPLLLSLSLLADNFSLYLTSLSPYCSLHPHSSSLFAPVSFLFLYACFSHFQFHVPASSSVSLTHTFTVHIYIY